MLCKRKYTPTPSPTDENNVSLRKTDLWRVDIGATRKVLCQATGPLAAVTGIALSAMSFCEAFCVPLLHEVREWAMESSPCPHLGWLCLRNPDGVTRYKDILTLRGGALYAQRPVVVFARSGTPWVLRKCADFSGWTDGKQDDRETLGSVQWRLHAVQSPEPGT